MKSSERTTASLILSRATTQLAASPHLREIATRDALTLLLHTLHISRAQFHADPDRTLTPEQCAGYEAAIARRLAHEPIQYITGEQEFYGITLRVTPAVLIPRPETEHLVEAVLAELTERSNKIDAVIPTETPHASDARSRGAPTNKDAVIPTEAAKRRSGGTAAFAFQPPATARPETTLRILDIGTGSGAIAIALARHLPHAHITATDISPAALLVARENAARHHAHVRFLESDLLDGLSEERDTQEAALTREARREPYEVLVSNPPYVPHRDRASLHPQVRDYEPSVALFAGEAPEDDDGLAIYRRLIPQARAALAPNGLLALEFGHGQRDALAALLTSWNNVRFVDDLQGIPRVALARRP